MSFIYENRSPIKSDLVEMKNIKIGDSYLNFSVTPEILSKLEKNSSLMYVRKINPDATMIQIGSKKTGNFDEMFLPMEFFKIVKVPKTNDVVNWLYDNQLIEFPIQWLPFKTQIDSISRFIGSTFQNNLKAIYLINTYTNNLYFNNDSFEVLIFYKTIVQQLGLFQSDRYSKFNTRSPKQSFIKTCLEINPKWHTKDAISTYILHELSLRGSISLDLDEVFTTQQRITFYSDPKAKETYLQKNEKVDIKDRIINMQNKDKFNKIANDDRYLKDLNQEVIDELELVIFNIKTLPQLNKILIIFIDKDNNKRFYLENFSYKFYISNQTSIINNDYIESFNESKHRLFVVNDISILKTLKFAVNDNYKKFMKKGII